MQKNYTSIHWPDRACRTAFLRYGILLTIAWLVVYGGASYITSLHSYRVRLHFDFEANMHFFPSAALIYLSLFPMLWLSPFVLHTPEKLQLFARSLMCLFVISGIGFLLLPGKEVHTHEVDSGFFNQIYVIADWINLNNNYLPSLHVGMAVICANAYSDNASPMRVMTMWIWAAAIAISTFLIHEHYVLDVVCGAAIGFLIAKSISDETRQCINLS